ncbi:hypothetical protein BU14_0098s0026 [Porphyra umbilicalis]|uniref:Uncharacterized protein n=1 Tax=Porphyra umbilicalis TaxID=2786 RepID=A0A1X6PDI6_PORUM|nr:hypothetical protein BU14_0098s0026 [Porphyra umbilicalis]|eukprot:OSX78800.1 hypothetical protein BU14_0098s0026 [Porphyra umbilicalis]
MHGEEAGKTFGLLDPRSTKHAPCTQHTSHANHHPRQAGMHSSPPRLRNTTHHAGTTWFSSCRPSSSPSTSTLPVRDDGTCTPSATVRRLSGGSHGAAIAGRTRRSSIFAASLTAGRGRLRVPASPRPPDDGVAIRPASATAAATRAAPAASREADADPIGRSGCGCCHPRGPADATADADATVWAMGLGTRATGDGVRPVRGGGIRPTDRRGNGRGSVATPGTTRRSGRSTGPPVGAARRVVSPPPPPTPPPPPPPSAVVTTSTPPAPRSTNDDAGVAADAAAASRPAAGSGRFLRNRRSAARRVSRATLESTDARWAAARVRATSLAASSLADASRAATSWAAAALAAAAAAAAPAAAAAAVAVVDTGGSGTADTTTATEEEPVDGCRGAGPPADGGSGGGAEPLGEEDEAPATVSGG